MQTKIIFFLSRVFADKPQKQDPGTDTGICTEGYKKGYFFLN